MLMLDIEDILILILQISFTLDRVYGLNEVYIWKKYWFNRIG